MPRTAKTPSDKIAKEAKPKKRGRPRKTAIKKEIPVVQPPPVVEKPKVKRFTYLFTVGRRKEAVARVRYYRKGEGKFTVNAKPIEQYFSTLETQNIVKMPIQAVSATLDGDISIKVQGGGKRGQADASRLGIARLLILLDKKNRPTLKRLGYLTRDPRVKERKKYGLKRARRAPQWQKR
ncbi:MAG: 30S ribosomal protein S9 [Patescibacteria group bacterium]